MKLWPKVRILLISFFFLAETIAAPTVAVTAWNNRILSGEQLSAALAPPISSENCQNVKRRQRSDAIFPSFFFQTERQWMARWNFSTELWPAMQQQRRHFDSFSKIFPLTSHRPDGSFLIGSLKRRCLPSSFACSTDSIVSKFSKFVYTIVQQPEKCRWKQFSLFIVSRWHLNADVRLTENQCAPVVQPAVTRWEWIEKKNPFPLSSSLNFFSKNKNKNRKKKWPTGASGNGRHVSDRGTILLNETKSEPSVPWSLSFDKIQVCSNTVNFNSFGEKRNEWPLVSTRTEWTDFPIIWFVNQLEICHSLARQAHPSAL